MNLLFLFTFLLSISNSYSQYIVNDNLTVHYDTLYSNNYRFKHALNETYIIDQNNNNTYDCKYDCANTNNCLGIYENYDNEYYCNLLSNIEGNKKVTEKSNSILKINHLMYSLENHSISGFIWDTSTFSNDKRISNVTLYLDINHNGFLDDGEPSIIGNNKDRFIFNNITAGTYLLRQITPDNCVQFFPGLNGSFIIGDNNIKGDGYIDNIIRYKHHGHSYGGYINNSNYKIKNDNFSFILGNDNTTFMSFYPNHSMEAIFIDESIINKDGYDLIINVLESNSSTIANISVSHDDQNFKYLGVLNSSNSENLYDLDDINYNKQVNYIKLDFIGNNQPLNIINIGAYNNSIYLPPYAYNINVPKKESIVFINDCHYDLECSVYCGFNLLNDNDYNSCSYGCDIFEETNVCNCSNNSVLNEDYNFKHDLCIHGCEYGIQKHIFPNYTLLTNYNGYSESIIDINNTCDVNCLDNLLDSCNSMNECRSLSYSENNIIGNLFNNYKHTYEKNSFFIVKNNYFDTTQTSTGTSTQTSTRTSTGTSTQTSTGTSTGNRTENIIVNDITKKSKIDNTYKNIIIIIVSICLLLIIVMLIKLINKCNQPKLPIQNLPQQNHISISNPVYEPNFENQDQYQNENQDQSQNENKNKNERASLYNDIDPAYGYDAVTYDAVNDEYLEIVND